MGYKKEAYLYLSFHYTGKKDLQKSTPKSPNADDHARPDVIFWAVEYHSPPESQLAFHIYYVKYENALTCKRISWDSGGMMF